MSAGPKSLRGSLGRLESRATTRRLPAAAFPCAHGGRQAAAITSGVGERLATTLGMPPGAVASAPAAGDIGPPQSGRCGFVVNGLSVPRIAVRAGVRHDRLEAGRSSGSQSAGGGSRHRFRPPRSKGSWCAARSLPRVQARRPGPPPGREGGRGCGRRRRGGCGLPPYRSPIFDSHACVLTWLYIVASGSGSSQSGSGSSR